MSTRSAAATIQPAGNGDHQRPSRPREIPARSWSRSESGDRQRTDGALRDDRRAVGAEGVVSAALTDQEKITYLELMKALLDHGANVNAQVGEKLWFRSFTNDYTWVDPAGATAFWRAAQSSDTAAMHLLIEYKRRSEARHQSRRHAADGRRRDWLGGELERECSGIRWSTP